VRCEKNGWKYVAAAYFPNETLTFAKVRSKFLLDLPGVTANGADGIVFITNQGLSPGERDDLADLATKAGHRALVYHLERIRALLDSPAGYGLRLEFLRVPMSLEEQMSFFSRRDSSLSRALEQHTATILAELARRFDRLEGNGFNDDSMAPIDLAQHTYAIAGPIAASRNIGPQPPLPVTLASLTTEWLCMLHGALLFDSAEPGTGNLRTHQIWIGSPGSGLDDATYVPPGPEEVPRLVDALVSDWNESYQDLVRQSRQDVLRAITRFHHRFLKIHPFGDGNGRVARYLLTLQSKALLKEERRIVLNDRIPYLAALVKADEGDFSPLEAVITQAIYGQEFVDGSPCQMSGQSCPACKIGVLDIDSDGNGVRCNKCGLYAPA